MNNTKPFIKYGDEFYVPEYDGDKWVVDMTQNSDYEEFVSTTTVNSAAIDENYYEYVYGPGAVRMTPMNKIFPLWLMNEFRVWAKDYIKSNYCYQNAMFAQKFFEMHGYDDIEIVDGYYKADLVKFAKLLEKKPRFEATSLELTSHRYLKKGNYYFDPTIEFVFGKAFIKVFYYEAARIFKPATLFAFSKAETAARFPEVVPSSPVLDILLTMSTLGCDNDEETPQSGFLNEYGEYVRGEMISNFKWREEYA